MVNAMKKTLKKQDRNDFMSRIERLDPAFAATLVKARDDRKPWELEKKTALKSESPIMMMGLGFGLALTALFVANDPDAVQALLLKSGWPAQFLSYATNGISILIIGLVIFYLTSIIRIVNPRATGRWNAAGLVVGAVAAVGVTNIDESYIQAGYQYAGIEHPADILTLAQVHTAGFTNIDWASVVMVSSSPK